VEHLVRVIVLAGSRSGERLRHRPALTVVAAPFNVGGAAAHEQLKADGCSVCSLTFSPTGMVAYVEERAP
jgi:hypothetical protein